MIIHSKKLLCSKKSSPVEVLGSFPTNFSYSAYLLMKRGDYYYAIVNNGPQNGSTNINVQTLNFISKTTDFKTWTGSGIGSGCTCYDEISDSFFSVTLGERYQTGASDNAYGYYITKINPDDFSYTTKTIGTYSMTGNSRGISPIQRVGNYLMLVYYTGGHNTNIYYSSNNGSSWSSTKHCSISSFGYGGTSVTFMGNGQKAFGNGYFSTSTSYVKKVFSSPTSAVTSSASCSYCDRPLYTSSNNFYNINSNILYLSNNLTSNTASLSLRPQPSNASATASNGSFAVFYDNYFITMSSYWSYISDGEPLPYAGKIVLYNLSSGTCYLFDTGLDLIYTSGSGTYAMHKAYGKIVGFIDNYIYFICQINNVSGYKLVRVPIDYVLEKMKVYS